MLTLTCILKTGFVADATEALSDHLLTHLPADWPREREETFNIAFADSPSPRVVLTTRWLGQLDKGQLAEIMGIWFGVRPDCYRPAVDLLHYGIECTPGVTVD
jgi:hypothetical protein